MTNKERGVFINFLKNNGALTIFRGAIRTHGIDSKDFKEYETNVSAIFAIRYAFPWEKIIGVDYWKNLNDKWETICARNNFSDIQGYSTDPDKLKEAISELFEGKQWRKIKNNSMKDFIFHDFTQRAVCRKMEADEFSLNHSDKSHSITFNQELSERVKSMGLNKMRVMENGITGELYFVFNKEEGMNICYTGAKSDNRRPNATFNNKKLTEFMAERLSHPYGKREVYKLSRNMAKSDDFLTFKILYLPQR